jgi:hypothetical protein
MENKYQVGITTGVVMSVITVNATVGEDRRLAVELPPDAPVGPVEVQIRPLSGEDAPARHPLTREEARARLLAAGLLSTARYAPEDAQPLSPEESERLSHLFASERLTSELIDEDRGPR